MYELGECLDWCVKEGVPRTIITHCGSEIVTGDEGELARKLRAIVTKRAVEVRIAHDGMADPAIDNADGESCRITLAKSEDMMK